MLIESTSYSFEQDARLTARASKTPVIIMSRTRYLSVFALILTAFSFGSAQEKASIITGDVTGVSASRIAITSRSGPVDVILNAATQVKRIPADNLKLTAAIDANVSEIAIGDKVMASGILSADGRSLPARTIYLITKSEMAQKIAKDAEAWRTRGISGKVTSINLQTNQIILETGGLMAKRAVTLTPKANATFLRYAPDSVKFADAKVSAIGEIKAGDEIRALGDRNVDGTAFAAETVLTGGFRQSAGTIKSVDLAAKSVVITELNTKKDITVWFADAVLMKRFPEEMATRLAGMQAGGGVQAIRPAGGGSMPGGGQQPGGGPRSGGGLSEMIDRLPNMTAAQLKVGETIAILTSETTPGADSVKAIKLIAGVDPFIKLAQVARAGAQRGTGGNNINFNIPGLDGGNIP